MSPRASSEPARLATHLVEGLRPSSLHDSLSIRWRLIVLMVAVGGASVGLVVGTTLFRTNAAAEQVAYERLTAQRTLVSSSLERFFADAADEIRMLSADPATATAIGQLEIAFERLAEEPLPASADGELRAEVARVLDSGSEGATESSIDRTMVRSHSGRFVQFHHLGGADRPDDTRYGWLHGFHQPRLRRITDAWQLHDLFFISSDGDILLTAASEIDLGTNLHSGPFAKSSLAGVVSGSLSDPDPDRVVLSDYSWYIPSLSAPALFLASPVVVDGDVVGVVAGQIQLERIDAIVSTGGWPQSTSGSSGQTYLVGSDRVMRSQDRLQSERPSEALDAVGDRLPESQIAELRRTGRSTLLRTVDTDAVTAALENRSGTMQTRNSRGIPVFASFGRVALPPPLDWAILSEIDQSEVKAPAREMVRDSVTIGIVAAAVVIVMSVLLARMFMNPYRQLTRAGQDVLGSQVNTDFDHDGRGEFAALAGTFNEMVTTLGKERERSNAAAEGAQSLLAAVLPVPLAEQPPETTSFDVGNAVVVRIGLDVDAITTGDADEASRRLGAVREALVARAASHNVEHIQHLPAGATALGEGVGILVVPADRLPARAASRAVGIAIELVRHLEELGYEEGIDFGAVASVASAGPTVASILGSPVRRGIYTGPAVSTSAALLRIAREEQSSAPAVIVDRRIDPVGHKFCDGPDLPLVDGSTMATRLWSPTSERSGQPDQTWMIGAEHG